MKTKKLTALILAVIMVFSVLPISAYAEDEVIPISEYGGQIKSGKTYSISNAEEFLLFFNITDTEYNNVKVILTKDIVINTGVFSLDEDKNLLYNAKAITAENMPRSFTPISRFEGTFDGQYYTLSGLYCNSEFSGLFVLSDSSTIQNLNIKNSAFIGKSATGSICSQATGNTIIKHCKSDAFVIGKSDVGGISGTGGSIESCLFNGTVCGIDYVGGIVGSGASPIKNSGNTGDVYGTGYWIGGFAGYFGGTAENCFNTGDVYGNYATGGFIGFITIQQYASSLSGSTSYYLSNCYTSGNVSGQNPGNFFGFSSSDFSIFWCCYFVGDNDDPANYYGDIEKSYQEYLNHVESDPFGMGVVVMDIGVRPISKENLKTKESYKFPFLLSNYIFDYCNENDGYPLPQSLHKKHVWGEYVLNEVDRTKTAKCISEGCKATDTKKSGLNLNLWAQTNSDGSTLRFITCVDSLKYREVGFVITNADNPNQTIKRSSKVVYSKIIAGGKSVSAYDITGDENMKYILPNMGGRSFAQA